MDKALVTEFTTLLQQIVQLLATDYEKENCDLLRKESQC